MTAIKFAYSKVLLAAPLTLKGLQQQMDLHVLCDLIP